MHDSCRLWLGSACEYMRFGSLSDRERREWLYVRCVPLVSPLPSQPHFTPHSRVTAPRSRLSRILYDWVSLTAHRKYRCAGVCTSTQARKWKEGWKDGFPQGLRTGNWVAPTYFNKIDREQRSEKLSNGLLLDVSGCPRREGIPHEFSCYLLSGIQVMQKTMVPHPISLFSNKWSWPPTHLFS